MFASQNCQRKRTVDYLGGLWGGKAGVSTARSRKSWHSSASPGTSGTVQKAATASLYYKACHMCYACAKVPYMSCYACMYLCAWLHAWTYHGCVHGCLTMVGWIQLCMYGMVCMHALSCSVPKGMEWHEMLR